jgi:hypothetical protein
MAIPGLARNGMDAIVLANWACLAVTLAAVECILHGQELFPSSQPNKALHPSAASAAIGGRG